MFIIYKGFITRRMLRANKDKVFIFGDNEVRLGLGGQAKEMRGEPNALGIRTKRFPSSRKKAYWSDSNFDTNIILIEQDLINVEKILIRNISVVFPYCGIGVGMSGMQTKCPRTFQYLIKRLSQLFKEYGFIITDDL